jgi:pilus assembly protein FimV
MARKLAAVVFSLGCLQASSVMALGLGELELQSFLNEPLKASVDLLNIGSLHEDEIKIRLATSDDFDKLGLERAYFLTSLTFEVSADENGHAQINITSEEPVLEPYLDFIVEARWPSGRLLRNYTILIDPPVFSNATTVAVSASERVAEVEGIPAPAKKNEEVVSSGTRVDIRSSDLAPGAMPQRSYNSATAPSPTPGSRYMISRDQTLWQIASMAKPEGATVHQTMLDIQRLNPDAFINGNINRIKAGYIVYLPSATDISSADVSSALAEVREQNAAWRDGRDAELYASGGPSLRISAEPEDAATTASVDAGNATAEVSTSLTDGAPTPDDSTDAESSSVSSDATGEAQERLAAAEEQLETLQRIVSLKDDQIAALQNALAEAGVASAVETEVDLSNAESPAETIVEVEGVSGDVALGDSIAEGAVETSETDVEPQSNVTPEPAVVEQEIKQTPSSEKASSLEPAVAADTDSTRGWMEYLLYVIGALIVGVLGFVLVRRRNKDDESAPAQATASSDDVFSGVELTAGSLKVEEQEEDEEEPEVPASVRNNRGYGEHKHDEYASDVDAADALAEADIYIAYGRHPQAIDLLNNALANEPGNPVYRLKLLEVYAELNDHAAATTQFSALQEIGDVSSIAQGESLMERFSSEAEPEPSVTSSPARSDTSSPGLSPNPLEMMTDSGDDLEADFSGLEIEEQSLIGDEDDDLDLSADFESGNSSDFEDEELVIAADSNGLSTKLDLARAYLDMGDDDGARQILEEVVAEGTDELKAEANALLDRIGK